MGKKQIVYDDFNSHIRSDQSTMATLTTNCGSPSLRNGVKIIEVEQAEISPEFERFIYEIDGKFYLIRIRKLTPLECWRLMGFSDTDYEKAAAVNSNTQLYKQAGNSIVKNVLEHLFRMFLPTDKVAALKLQALALLG